MATSPTHRCISCRGRCRRVEVDIPESARGVPNLMYLGANTFSLWFPNDETGSMRWWFCEDCDGTGLRRRFGPSDVRAATKWAQRCGFRFPETPSTHARGVVKGPFAMREGDCIAGELDCEDDTPAPKLSTTLASC